MIKIEQLRNFVSSNFTNAILSGKIVNDKIDLNLKLDPKETNNNFMHMYNVDLDKIRKEPEKVLNYLLEKYLENNTIIGIHYFANIQYHSDKIAFIINGLNNNFIIALRKDCMNLLPDDFVSKLEFAKKKGILKTLEEFDIKKINISNFSKNNLYNNYKTGLRENTIEDGVFYYDALRITDSKGEVINYKGELEFVFKMLELLIEKGNINLDNLKRLKNIFESGHYNLMMDYELNDTIKFKADSNEDLFVFIKFLKKYLDTYKDNVKENQLVLKLR